MSKIPDAKVAQRYGVVLRTIDRWDRKPALGFPAAEYINGRKYRDAEKLAAWDHARALSSKTSKRDAAAVTHAADATAGMA